MKLQTKKILAFGTLWFASMLVAIPAHADNWNDRDGRRPFKMKFAGGFVRSIVQEELAMGQPTGVLGRRNIAIAKYRGTLGRGDTMTVTVGGPPVSSDTCPQGLVKIGDVVEYNIVNTFNDLSILYGNGTGVVCLNPADPTADLVVEIDGNFLGGTGRFRDAGGEFSIRSGLDRTISFNTQFIVQNYVMFGYLTRGNDGDDD